MKTSQADRLRHIIQHAYANAPAVKEIMDGAGVSPDDIQTLADLDRIPVTSKDKVAELQAACPRHPAGAAWPVASASAVLGVAGSP